MIEKSCFKATTWNMNNKFSAGQPYLHELLNDSTICVINEHGLFPKELFKLQHIHPEFNAFGKSSRDLDDKDFGSKFGHCGCAILWRQKINNYVIPLPELGTDRICVLQVKMPGCIDIIVIGVYLPYYGCKIASFTEEISIVEDIIVKYNSTHTILAIGDVNAHIRINSYRSWGSSTHTGKIFDSTMNRLNMVITDLLPGTHGPNYTFNRNNCYSYVDHCAISKEALGLVKYTAILPESLLNCSDHLAAQICINISIPASKSRNMFARPAWGKVTPEERTRLYSAPLDIAVQNILLQFGLETNDILNSVFDKPIDNHDLNRFVQMLTEQMRNASYNLPMSKFNPSAKPFWSDALQALKDTSLEALRAWESAGRPRDSELHEQYKSAKKLFQKTYDQSQFEFEVNSVQELANKGELDQKYFWWYYNRLKKKCKGVAPIKDTAGNLITDVDEIRNEWTLYYQQLFNDNHEYKGDPDFYDSILLELEQIRGLDSNTPFLKGGPITHEEVFKMISGLKNMKAPGWDEISNEHLKYAGNLTKSAITYMLNKIVENECIPKNLKRGYMISLPKPQKDATIKTNNRGITLLPVFYKMFEKIVLMREKGWLFSQEIMNESQGGGREQISCLHTSFLTQESISYNLQVYGKAFSAFMDIMKAFDCVWLAGLLVKLYRKHMDLKSWKLLDNAYTDFECAVLVDGIPGPWFEVRRGVHQGGPLSMPIYQASMDDLLVELQQANVGTVIANKNLTSPAHADDISLVTYYKLAMNVLVKIAFNHSIKWFYTFSVDKCIFMEFGNISKAEREIPIRLGNEILKAKPQSKHMGLMLTNNAKLEMETYRSRANDLKSVTFAARSLGSKSVPIVPTVMNKVYNSVAIPKSLYGMEVVPINQSGLSEMEKEHRNMSKVIQNIPQNTPNASHLATVGWHTLDAKISVMKLSFLWRLLCLPLDNIYRVVLTFFLQLCLNNDDYVNPKSPTYSMFTYVRRYNLIDVLVDSLHADNEGNVLKYKNMIKKVVYTHETNCWRATMSLLYNLPFYRFCVHDINIHPWWNFVKSTPSFFRQVSSVIALICGTQPKFFQCNFDNKFCCLCPDRILDSAIHILFECPALNVHRNLYISKIHLSMPFAMKNEFNNMTHSDKLIFILSAMNSKYCQEFLIIYKSMSLFIHEMYKVRKKLYEPP